MNTRLDYADLKPFYMVYLCNSNLPAEDVSYSSAFGI